MAFRDTLNNWPGLSVEAFSTCIHQRNIGSVAHFIQMSTDLYIIQGANG